VIKHTLPDGSVINLPENLQVVSKLSVSNLATQTQSTIKDLHSAIETLESKLKASHQYGEALKRTNGAQDIIKDQHSAIETLESKLKASNQYVDTLKADNAALYAELEQKKLELEN